jgi:hypothetical protein
MTTEELTKLFQALRGNAEQGVALLTDPRDTSFVSALPEGDPLHAVTDEEVIASIKSVPNHY